jgi:hypothetical protein
MAESLKFAKWLVKILMGELISPERNPRKVLCAESLE